MYVVYRRFVLESMIVVSIWVTICLDLYVKFYSFHTSLFALPCFPFFFFFAALTKQTNPNWKAFFFVTDEKPFEKELQQMIQKHKDERLVYLDVPITHRPAVCFMGCCGFDCLFNVVVCM